MGSATKISSLKKHRLWMVEWTRRGIVRCSTIIQLNRVRSALWAHWTKNLNHRTYWIDVKCRHTLHLSHKTDLPCDRMVRWEHRKWSRNESAHCKCVFNICSSSRCYTVGIPSQQGKTGPEIRYVLSRTATKSSDARRASWPRRCRCILEWWIRILKCER